MKSHSPEADRRRIEAADRTYGATFSRIPADVFRPDQEPMHYGVGWVRPHNRGVRVGQTGNNNSYWANDPTFSNKSRTADRIGWRAIQDARRRNGQ